MGRLTSRDRLSGVINLVPVFVEPSESLVIVVQSPALMSIRDILHCFVSFFSVVISHLLRLFSFRSVPWPPA
jgi:hypothetical protein